MRRRLLILLSLFTAGCFLYSCSDPSAMNNSLDIPQEFEITAVFADGCEVQWKSVENAEYYIIRAESEEIIELQTKESALLVEKLDKDIQYEISVCACNELKKSQFSQKLTFITNTRGTERKNRK